MPVNATQRKVISDLVKGVMSYEEDTKTNFNYDSVIVGGTLTIGSIGVPVIWVNGNSRFEVFIAQDIAAAITTGGSPLASGAVIGLLVGDQFGSGFNKADIDLSAGDTTMTILYRGDATVVDVGIDWGTAASPAQVLFRDQLEAQRVTFNDNATVVNPTYL